MRLRHPAVVLHRLLLCRQSGKHDGRLVGRPTSHRRYLSRLSLLFNKTLLLVQLARAALPAERAARPQELSLVRHRDYTEHHAGQGRLRLGLLSARHHVRLQGERRGPGAHLHRAVCVAHKLIQRESVHVRVVLAGIRLIRQLLRSDRLDNEVFLFQCEISVRQVSHRAHAAGVALAQVHLQGLCLQVFAAGRVFGVAAGGAKQQRSGRKRVDQ